MTFSPDPRIVEADTAGRALARRAAGWPGAPALVYPEHGATITYGQWYDRAQAAARALLDLGLDPGDRVALLAENCVEWSVAQMATALAGLVLVPVNTHSRSEDLHHVLDQSGSRVLFLTESFRSNPFLELVDSIRDRLPHLRHTVLIGGSGGAPWPSLDDLVDAGSHSVTDLPSVDGRDPAVIIYTSGTTGRPKGVVLRHTDVMADGRAVFDRLRVTGDDVVTSIVPLFHSGSYCGVLPGCLAVGAVYVGTSAFDAVAMMELIQSRRVTVLMSVPTTLLALLQHPRRGDFDLTSLRVATCGGSDADPAMLEACMREFPVPFALQGYGLTEAAGPIASPAPDGIPNTTTVGRPLDGWQVRITSPASGEVLPPLVSGEIQVMSDHLMTEYFGMPDATAGAFTEDGWLRTGDLGELTPDGELRMTGGRLKDMILRGGENIYPAEIENTLMEHPQVNGVAVFALPDSQLGEIVAAAVTCAGTPSPDDLKAFCAERIARYKVPAVFYAVTDFPHTASGKIRKAELRAQAQAGSLDVLEGAL